MEERTIGGMGEEGGEHAQEEGDGVTECGVMELIKSVYNHANFMVYSREQVNTS
jgi:hypothetical protein